MMKPWKKTLLIDLSALLLGFSLVLAFAPYEIFPLAVLAPAGLLALWLNKTPKHAFWIGFLFGLGLFSGGIYWVFHSIHVFGDIPTFPSSLIAGGLFAILALYPATTGYLLNRYFPFNNNAKLIFAFPAIWVALEWVRSWLCTGFPWLLIGYSQTNSPLKGFAAILGVYGVSLAVLMSSGLLLNAYIKFKLKDYRQLYFSLLAIVSIWIAGSLLTLIPWTKPEGNAIPVSLVQGNIPQALKWSPDHLQLSFNRYQQLTESLWGQGKLVIWPEAAIPMPLQNARNFINMMDSKAQKTGTHLIIGIPIQTPAADGYFNGVLALGKDKGAYLKRRLVPFGEYVPLAEYFSRIINSLNVPLPDSLPGNLSQAPLTIGNVKISTSICYEIAFPELVNVRDKTVGLLLTVSNDAWFGNSSAQAQHLQMAQMRALELARPVLFVSNDGITAIIAANGNVESAAPQHTIYVLNGKVQPTIGLTPWMKNGMDPILAILITLIVVATRSNRLVVKTQEKHGKTAEDTSL